ncbi:hypothetical protein BLOT_004301 [Blomia tropicalis]|nr:hypothetical protein BLOT_004301 [Blomia tropicalis]
MHLTLIERHLGQRLSFNFHIDATLSSVNVNLQADFKRISKGCNICLARGKHDNSKEGPFLELKEKNH